MGEPGADGETPLFTETPAAGGARRADAAFDLALDGLLARCRRLVDS
jgi:hypothetical protein